MSDAAVQGQMALSAVRAGDLISYPGPPRRQQLAEFFQVGSTHLGVATLVGSRLQVVEIDYNGYRTRDLRAVVRHYDRVHVLRLPVDDVVARTIADRALAHLGTEMTYAHRLARFGFAWANFRSIDHPHIETWARALFPIAALIAWTLGRDKVTCSGWVMKLIGEAGGELDGPMRCDSSLPHAAHATAGRRPHRGARAHLCSPGDIWCSTAHKYRLVASPVRPVAKEARQDGPPRGHTMHDPGAGGLRKTRRRPESAMTPDEMNGSFDSRRRCRSRFGQ